VTSVELKNVWKYYGDVLAVEDASWRCADGEFFSILGPSGCGKSSTLRMIAGLEEISGGEIWFDQTLVNNLHPSERNVAMVFETWALYPNMTVYNNIAFPLWVRNLPALKIDEKVRWAADFLNLTDILDSGVGSLSGGQKQRVSIGRAIVREPNVLIMDEPISHLDAGLRARMRDELEDQVRRLGVTTLYITHDQVESMAMADRIAIMNLGRIQQIGTPREIYELPANEFVAGFIGEPPMNFALCELKISEADVHVHSPSFDLKVSEQNQGKLSRQPSGMNLKLGIRPESIMVNDPGSDGGLGARVKFVEPQGDRTIITVELVGSETFLIQAGPDTRPRMGEQVELQLDMSKAHLFDAETGVNILA
jgi:multiple sugar transport system ATP-binding protein